jgi:hypothetical protein
MGGLSIYGKEQALIGSISGYVGFFTYMPDIAGVSGVEASGSGYARVAYGAGTNATESTTKVYMTNDAAIEFAALSADLVDIVGWGLWDAITGGNLIAFGPMLDVAESEITKTFTSGNQPRFPIAELKVGID